MMGTVCFHRLLHAFLFVCVVVFSLGSNPAMSTGLERLLMPGSVIEGHAEIEANCDACHDADSDQASAPLCIACHEDVGADIDVDSGFHGRFPGSQRNECITCHTDHEGRDADIVMIDAGLFDHRWTDFVLRGAHIRLACTDCHVADKDYRDAPSHCTGCHLAADAHDGGLGKQCDSCHSSTNWREIRFDHDQTSYPLTGGHAAVACDDCHRDNNFTIAPKTCGGCHKIDDIHAGAKGSACDNCHSTTSWSGIQFDHATTGFPLSDGHGGLQCEDCHRREDFKDSFQNGCVDCHSGEDDHQGRNGQQCDSCHEPTSWANTSFDHADTGFALVEAHVELECSACHKASTAEAVLDSCGSCHAIDDSHAGQLGGDCNQCHVQTKWKQWIRFDHDLTAFPLTGLHATVACGACHESNRFHDAATDCASCHRDDDPHEGGLGDECATCHSSNDWLVTTFDHNVHTGFPIDGGHEGVGCVDCHRDATLNASDVSSTCGGCHMTDDVHEGQFGAQCDQCHSTATFEGAEALGRRAP